MKGPFIAETTLGLALSILSLLLLLFFGNLVSRKGQGRPYSPLSDFPFELGGERPSPWTRVPVYALAVAVLLLDSSLLFACSDPDFSHLLILGILLSALGLLKAVAMCFLFHVPAYRFKPHLGLFTVYAGLTGLSLVIASLALMNLGKMMKELLPAYEALPYVGMGILILFAIAEFVLLFNPKLSSWPKLEAEMEEDGSISTKRPKIFVLAATEWATVGLDVLGAVFLGVFLLLLILPLM